MKRHSNDVIHFRNMTAEERQQHAEHLRNIMGKYRVPGRIRHSWKDRIRMAEVRMTGEHNVIPESDEPAF